MLRRLLMLLSVLSLVLCVATAGIWVRSYWISEGFVDARGGHASIGRIARGRVAVITMDARPEAVDFEWVRWAFPIDWEELPMLPGAFAAGYQSAGEFRFLGFVRRGGTQSYIVSKNPWTFEDRPYRLTMVPLWFVCAVTAWPLLPLAARCIRWLRRRPVPGLCASCGYDLRASPDRCPECGATAAAKGAE
jgi:hypothetical protein